LDVKVLITGESGVGKVSSRGDPPAKPADRSVCDDQLRGAARALLESQLFGGHDRVTGASGHVRLARARAGRLIFLDDVAEMSPRIQALLLQWFEAARSSASGPVASDGPQRRVILRRIAISSSVWWRGPSAKTSTTG
jgi:DNA-binding NtrC family response regulator